MSLRFSSQIRRLWPSRDARFSRTLPAVWLALALAFANCWAALPANAEANDKAPAVHTIYRGQTLGMIAKRYRVTVEAICTANGIRQNHAIRPGDKLVIPALADKDGSRASDVREDLLAGGAKGKAAAAKASSKTVASKASPASKASSNKQTVGEPRSHTVYSGQTLGMIAKRYGVSVDAIAYANDFSASEPIKPGQELVIPARGDKDGSLARKSLRNAEPEPEQRAAPESAPKKSAASPRLHQVASGHTLGKIAARYRVSVDALCRANEITARTPLQVGQELVVPATSDTTGDAALAWRRQRLRSNQHSTPASQDWQDFKKAAWKRGYITLESPNGDKRWSGYVIGPGNKLLPLARQKVSDVLASWRTGKKTTIHPRLVRLIAQVSDTFGGRRIRVVSGYREHSHSSNSRHPEGRALDFSVNGVPNWAIRDYLRRLPDVGVGYYPNSSFVHLDVRDKATYWIDVSKPGEPPRYVHKSYGQKL